MDNVCYKRGESPKCRFFVSELTSWCINRKCKGRKVPTLEPCEHYQPQQEIKSIGFLKRLFS
jgi:hypothetical protein